MKKSTTGLCAALLAAFSLPATAGTQPADISGKAPVPVTAAEKEESVFDKIWGWTVLYKNPDNSILEEVAFTGRYQGQYYNADSDTGSVDDWENRRFHLGLQLAMFDNKVKIKAEMITAEDLDPFYSSMRDLYIEYAHSKAFTVRAGKFEPKFTKEYSTSSREILTFERSQLVNQFRPDYSSGTAVFGKAQKWNWYAAVFSNEVDKEFGQFRGGWSGFVSLGYDLKDALGLKEAELRLDYMHSDIDAADDTVFNYFDDGLSLNFTAKQGQWGLINDFIGGFGDKSNAFSWVLMPTYNFTDKLQAVMRGTLSFSDEDNGLSGQSRYERAAGGTAGDQYKALLAGLNYYLYGHKLKLMTSMEYANMEGGTGPGYDGWTFMTGVRVAW
ncbi:MAG: porin [Verrucomicrobiota bacterium]